MKRKLLAACPFLMAVFLILSIYAVVGQYDDNEPVSTNPLKVAKVTKVIDGDTFEVDLDGKKERVRMIGIVSPESVNPDPNKNTPQGKKAEEFTREKLTGKSVELEFDVMERDKSKRLLCYVYVDGTMFNKTMLSEGMARIQTSPPNIRYEEEFISLHTEARKNQIGIWKKDE